MTSLLSRWNLLPAHRPAVVQAIAKALAAHHYPARSLEEALSPNVQLWMRLLPEAEIAAEAAFKSLDCLSVPSEKEPIGLFWQTADGKWHFSPGSLNRGDIHDNGRPIRIAYLGEEAK